LDRNAILICELFLLTVLTVTPAVSQIDRTLDGASNSVVIRSQFQSIADEVISKAGFDSSARIDIIVEGEKWRALAENAFIEALRNNGNIPVFGSETGADRVLHLFILSTSQKAKSIGGDKFEREIVTSLEARTELKGGNDIKLLGTFRRSWVDTSNVLPDSGFPDDNKEKTGVLPLLLTPLVVIGSAILIVYLFFTVRS
jgi:hypothetical protein